MLINTLKELWFSEKEAKVYLACLELWNALVSSIARHSWEHRITTYSILKDFKKSWIAQELIKNKVKYFSVIEPEKLLELEEKKVNKIKKAMPEFLAISNAFRNKPKVYFYDNTEWLIQIYEDLLTSTTEIKAFLWFSEIDNRKFEKYAINEFLLKRLKNNIYAKVILPKNNKNIEYKKLDKKYNRESILLDSDIFKMKNEINLYSWDKIAISLFSKNETWWLIIQSKSLHDSLESLFDLIWSTNKQ